MNSLDRLIVFLSRILANFRRKLIKVAKAKDDALISLYGGHLESNFKWTERKLLRKLEVINFLHPRDKIFQGHIFNEEYSCVLHNVVVDSQTGLVFLKDGQILEESTAWPKDHLLLNSVPKPMFTCVSKRIEDFNVVILPSNGFYHWLVEDLPIFLETIERFPDSKVMVYERAPSYVLDFLTMQGYVYQFIPRYSRLERLNFVNKGPNTEWSHPKHLSILRKEFSQFRNPKSSKIKIYVSRETSTRSPFFENWLVSSLDKSGWLIVKAEELSLSDQISLFSSAGVICGVHGAGLSGMVWMPSNASVIELSPKNFVPCFARMASALNFKYTLINFSGKPKDQILNEILNASE